jgi:hypothetical protein
MVICHGACKVQQSPRQITFRRLLDITSYVTLLRIFIARAFCPRSAPRGVLPVKLVHGGTFISAMRSAFRWRGVFMRLRRSCLFRPPPGASNILCFRPLCLPPSRPALKVINHFFIPRPLPTTSLSHPPRLGSQLEAPVQRLVSMCSRFLLVMRRSD